jgi:8-oxo-dGTP pyrophosphatase MutT (NUDIX family)
VVSGALEAGETVLAGVLREVREEIGEHARVRPLGALHTATFSYDENVPFMLSLCYLMAYEGGEIVPGDDMLGAAYRWVKPEEIETLSITSPANQRWLAERAVELYRAYTQQNVSLWHEMEIVP